MVHIDAPITHCVIPDLFRDPPAFAQKASAGKGRHTRKPEFATLDPGHKPGLTVSVAICSKLIPL